MKVVLGKMSQTASELMVQKGWMLFQMALDWDCQKATGEPRHNQGMNLASVQGRGALSMDMCAVLRMSLGVCRDSFSQGAVLASSRGSSMDSLSPFLLLLTLLQMRTLSKRMLSPAPYMVLVNEIVLKKSRPFSPPPKCNRLLNRQLASLEKEPKFKAMSAKNKLKTERFEGSQPHLCISPPVTIRQGVRRIGC